MIDYPLAVYGTLRRGHHNFQWALSDVPVVELGARMRGFSMRTHGGFPAIFEASPDSEVTVDVFDLAAVSNGEEILDNIDRMERACGYERRLVSLADGSPVWAYVMPHERGSRFPHEIEDGDWNTYCEQTKGGL